MIHAKEINFNNDRFCVEMRLKGKSISFLLICAFVSVIYHLYKLDNREIFFEDAEITNWSRNCDTGICFQTVDYKTTKARYGRLYIYDQPRFLNGDIITLACSSPIPFTFFGYRQIDQSHRPPDCEFDSLKKKYGTRYEDDNNS